MVLCEFKNNVQPEKHYSIKKSSRKTYFSKKKVDTLLKIALFHLKWTFTVIKMHLIWNKAILKRVSTFFLLK